MSSPISSELSAVSQFQNQKLQRGRPLPAEQSGARNMQRAERDRDGILKKMDAELAKYEQAAARNPALRDKLDQIRKDFTKITQEQFAGMKARGGSDYMAFAGPLAGTFREFSSQLKSLTQPTTASSNAAAPRQSIIDAQG